MKIAHIQFPVFKPYEKPAVEIYVAGCKRNCKGCHNEEAKDFDNGYEAERELIQAYLTERESLFDIISVTGGDLLCQDKGDAFALSFLLRNQFPKKELWLFTGEDNFENIPLWAQIMFDVIKYGSYKEELKQEGFPASSNQKIWRKK